MLKLPPIRLDLQEDESDLRRKIARLLGIRDGDLIGYELLRQSVDARTGVPLQRVGGRRAQRAPGATGGCLFPVLWLPKCGTRTGCWQRGARA